MPSDRYIETRILCAGSAGGRDQTKAAKQIPVRHGTGILEYLISFA